MNPLAQSIAADRQRIGLTQGQLAERLGVSQQSVSNWEDGKALPRAKRLHELGALFGRSSATAVAINSLLHQTAQSSTTESDHMGSAVQHLPHGLQLEPIAQLTRAAADIATAAQALAESAAQIADAVSRMTKPPPREH